MSLITETYLEGLDAYNAGLYLVTTILYEKELDTMTPNQVLNKVIAHELRNDIKTKAPSSSPTHSALACKQVKKLKKMAIKGSPSEGRRGGMPKLLK